MAKFRRDGPKDPEAPAADDPDAAFVNTDNVEAVAADVAASIAARSPALDLTGSMNSASARWSCPVSYRVTV
jgi:hypothetical protein